MWHLEAHFSCHHLGSAVSPLPVTKKRRGVRVESIPGVLSCSSEMPGDFYAHAMVIQVDQVSALLDEAH